MLKLSKSESSLLRLFFSNPDREFYIHEIGRHIGKKPGIFQKTLYDLERMGVLTSRYQAHARYFRANKSYPIYADLKSIVFKTIGVMDSLTELMAGSGVIEFAFIYGSYARARENPASDIDLMIVGSLDETVILRRLDSLERAIGREINYRILTSTKMSGFFKAEDPFLKHVLKEPKIFLIGDESGLRKLIAGSSDQKGRA